MTGRRFELAADAVRRVAARDGSIFSADAAVAAEAAAFMGWTDAAARADALLPEIAALVEDAAAEPLNDVVLLGMGGSSLAALVIDALVPGGGPRLHVLDTTAPASVIAALDALDPATTLYIVASKSGTTIEPNTLYAIFRTHADEVLGRERAGRRFIALTDPGSALEALATTDALRACLSTPPDVGGRYSALTAFGLVPAALTGVDVASLVRSAQKVEDAYRAGTADTRLADFIIAAAERGTDKLVLLAEPELRPFGLWVEQLVAESLGKDGIGVVPVIAQDRWGEARGDEVFVVLRAAGSDEPRVPGGGAALVLELGDPHELGGWFVDWEWAVALVGAALGVNPFDQPNVAEAKAATNAVLSGKRRPLPSDVAVNGVEFTCAGALPRPAHPERSLTSALTRVLSATGSADYLALLAFVPDCEPLMDRLMRAASVVTLETACPVCVQMGPRYLHSTGQLHKGGPDSGVFVMLTTRDERDVRVPGKVWTLRDLYRAQADGDLITLAAHGRRVLRVDVGDASSAAMAHFCEALEAAARRSGAP